MPKRVHWLLDIKDGSPDAVMSSMMASQRLRAGCMMRFAKKFNAVVTAGSNVPDHTDTLIIGKPGAQNISFLEKNWLSTIKSKSEEGVNVVLDFTDNHLESQTELSSFYSKVVKIVDRSICSSDTLRISLKDKFIGEAFTIPDPIEVSLKEPKTNPIAPRTILWFGHRTNLVYLLKFLPCLQANFPIRVIILSDTVGLNILAQSNPILPNNLMVELMPWSKQALIDAAIESNVCVIPSDPSDKRKSGVSSNRLLTALALGLPTIASRLPSYLPFTEYFIDLNSPEAYNAIIDPCAFRQPVVEAQQNILPKYSLESIATMWFNNPLIY